MGFMGVCTDRWFAIRLEQWRRNAIWWIYGGGQSMKSGREKVQNFKTKKEQCGRSGHLAAKIVIVTERKKGGMGLLS